MLRHLVVALCALSSALAHTPRAVDDEPTTTSEESESETHTVKVGWSGFKFEPNVTEAKAGDVVEFEFYPPDHSVVQGHYDHGCIPFESVGGEDVGFYSGPQIISGISDPPKFQVKINDTEPIFFYCGADGSCMDKHMIGAINPNETHTLEGHLAIVEKAEFERVPGEDWPSEAPDDEEEDEDSGSGSGSGSGSSPASGGGSSGGSGHSSLSPGAIAGIAIGSAAVLILAAALIYLCGRRGGKDFAYRKSLQLPWGNSGSQGPASPFGFGGAEHKSVSHMSMGQGQGQGQEWNSPLGSPGTPGYAAVAQQQALAAPVGPHYTGTTVSGDPRAASQVTSSPPPGAPPVELATSNDPGNSPLPMYRQFSWRQDGESEYRPGK